MRVKSSYASLCCRVGLAAALSTSLSACGTVEDTRSWWREVRSEREPQYIGGGPRRLPVLNQQMHQSAAQQQPAAAPTYAPQPTASDAGSQPVHLYRHDSVGHPQYQSPPTSPAQSAGEAPNQPYDETSSQSSGTPSGQPGILNHISSWFSAAAQPPASAAAPKETNSEPLTLASNLPPRQRRKAISGNPDAVYKEPEITTELAMALPQDMPATLPPSSTDDLLFYLTTNPPKPPLSSDASEAASMAALPPAAPTSPEPQTPTPTQLSALVPASGSRKEEGGAGIENLDPNLASAPSNPLRADELSVTLQMASNEESTSSESPEYPPLHSVPPVPPALGEAKQHHPTVKKELEDAHQQSQTNREQTRQQILNEEPESLLTNPPAVPPAETVLPPSETPAAPAPAAEEEILPAPTSNYEEPQEELLATMSDMSVYEAAQPAPTTAAALSAPAPFLAPAAAPQPQPAAQPLAAVSAEMAQQPALLDVAIVPQLSSEMVTPQTPRVKAAVETGPGPATISIEQALQTSQPPATALPTPPASMAPVPPAAPLGRPMLIAPESGDAPAIILPPSQFHSSVQQPPAASASPLYRLKNGLMEVLTTIPEYVYVPALLENRAVNYSLLSPPPSAPQLM